MVRLDIRVRCPTKLSFVRKWAFHHEYVWPLLTCVLYSYYPQLYLDQALPSPQNPTTLPQLFAKDHHCTAMAPRRSATYMSPKPGTCGIPETAYEQEKRWNLERNMTLLEMRIRDQSNSILTSTKSPVRKPTKELKYTCKSCSERFDHRGMFNLHQRDAHPDVPAEPKPFVCDQCGCGYRTKGELKKHEERHPSDYQGMNRNRKSEVTSYAIAGRELLS